MPSTRILAQRPVAPPVAIPRLSAVAPECLSECLADGRRAAQRAGYMVEPLDGDAEGFVVRGDGDEWAVLVEQQYAEERAS